MADGAYPKRPFLRRAIAAGVVVISHEVEFDFRPPALAYGKLLSLAGLIVGMCVCGSAATGLFRRAAAAK